MTLPYLKSIWNALSLAMGLGLMCLPAPLTPETDIEAVDLPLADSLSVTQAQKRLIRSGVQGNIWGLQSLVRGAFHQSWPEFRGALVFLPYDENFRNAVPLAEFGEELLAQFRTSSMAKSFDHLSEPERQKLETYIRKDAAKYIYDVEEKRQAGRLRLGHTRAWTLNLPVESADGTAPTFSITMLRLQVPCLSCLAEKKPVDSLQCRSLHPDAVYLYQSDHIRVTFHELAHVIAALRGDVGSAYLTPAERNLEEVRANLFGGLMGVRIFGMVYADEFSVAVDRTAQSHSPASYFNPEAYRATEKWVQETGYTALGRLSLLELYEQANALAQAHALAAEEATALAQFVDKVGKESAADFQKRLKRVQESPEPVTHILVKNQILAYPPAVRSYDQSRLNLKNGNPALMHMLQHNPLRPEALKTNEPYTLKRSNAAEIAAYNDFNMKLFGGAACVASVEPKQLLAAAPKLGR